MSVTSASRTDRVIRLLSDYCRLVDGRAADEWAGLFAAGGAIVVRGQRVEGSEALRDFAAASPEGVHVTGLPAMDDADGEDLRVRSPWTFVRADGAGMMAGYYDDRVVDDGVTVRFLERTVEMIAAVQATAP